MRSCGGAVQGIRDHGLYLNRADDGFCYFDCGTYSYGPVDVVGAATASPSSSSSSSTSITTGKLLLASMTLPSLRIWLQSKDGDVTVEAAPLPNNVKSNEDAAVPDPQRFIVCSTTTRPEFRVVRQQQCRMATPTQPWMMQRVQWESTKRNSSSNGREDSNDNQQELPGPPYHCWVEEADHGGVRLVSMGATCVASGYVKEIVRSYSVENGKLCSVALHEGRLL